VDVAALGVAAWMRYARGIDERGGRIELRDPMEAELAARAAGAPEERVDALLGMSRVFGEDLRGNAGLRARLASWLGLLEREGAAAVVRAAARA
jgi:fructuronate reductase